MIKIVLADDHNIVRKGLRALLSGESEFEVIGEASNGLETLEVAERLQPDILILDLMMPGMNGLEVTSRLTKICPRIRIVILSMHCNEAYIYEALRSGAKAYILKDNTADELITAVRHVRDGLSYFSSSLPSHAIEAYKKKAEVDSLDPLEQLTTREREILQLAIKGRGNAEIASELGISQRTVETHCTNFMHKLGVTNRNQLVQFAVQRGILSSPDRLLINSADIKSRKV
jgi:DNA-binding NarL/FixJ family response regulator